MTETTTVIPSVNKIRALVQTDKAWAVKALVMLANQQTPDEFAAETTGYNNGRGFGKFDAEILTSFAKQILAGKQMSEKQFSVMFKRLPKYARQIHTILEEQVKREALLDEERIASAAKAETVKPVEQTYRDDEDEGCWVSVGGSVEVVVKPEPKPEPKVEHYSAEASSIGWIPGRVNNIVVYRDEAFEYVSTRRDFWDNEIISWKYRSVNGNWLTVWND